MQPQILIFNATNGKAVYEISDLSQDLYRFHYFVGTRFIELQEIENEILFNIQIKFRLIKLCNIL